MRTNAVGGLRRMQDETITEWRDQNWLQKGQRFWPLRVRVEVAAMRGLMTVASRKNGGVISFLSVLGKIDTQY